MKMAEVIDIIVYYILKFKNTCFCTLYAFTVWMVVKQFYLGFPRFVFFLRLVLFMAEAQCARCENPFGRAQLMEFLYFCDQRMVC